MTNYDEYGNEIDGTEDNGPKALRDALAKKDKELKELRAQLDGFAKESRQRKVADTLSAKGLPAKLGALIPQDADVDEWLTEYADLFGTRPTDDATSVDKGQEAPAEAAPQQVAPEVANSWEQIAATTQQGLAPTAANVHPALAQLAEHVAKGGDITEYMTAKGLTQQWG